MLVEFSLNFVYPITCGKNVQVYGVHSPRKHIESRHFYSCPPFPLKTLPQVLTITLLSREKLLVVIVWGIDFFSKIYSPNSRKVRRKP